MRQLQVQVPRESADRVIAVSEEFEGFSPVVLDARRANDRPWAVVLLNLPNAAVGEFIEKVQEEVEEATFVLTPRGVLPILTPIGDVHEQVHRVGHRSAVELVLGAMQSVGSWRSLLLYAVLSGLVAAYAVIFDTAYLLVAAMLIAPIGAPAMVCVIATATGEPDMFRQGASRFFVAAVLLALGALVLGLLYGLNTSTSTMEEISNLSLWAGMLAVVGGAAGAQSQIQSDRDSLVTATATGFLVAVAMSPPAAVLGLAIAIGRWDYAGQMAFVVLLSFIGVIAGGWLTLLSYGISPGVTGVMPGSATVRAVLAGGVILSLAALIAWQSTRMPSFRKADLTRETIEITRGVVGDMPGVRLIESSAHFSRPDLPISPEALVVNVLVARSDGVSEDPRRVEDRIRAAVQERLRAEFRGVAPFVVVTVLPPAQSGGGAR